MNPYPLASYAAHRFAGPLPLLTAAEADGYRARFYDEIGQTEASATRSAVDPTSWHQTRRWAYELATNPVLVDAMQVALGQDLILWGMCFWYKEPRTGKRIPWHQDGHYYPMLPRRTVTAWVALGPVSRANGGLRVVPGSGPALEEHVDLGDPDAGFTKGLRPGAVDEGAAVDLDLTPGEMVLFGEGTVHGSEANTSERPRLGFSVRYTTPDVKFFADKWSHPQRIRNYLVRGEDRHRLNDGLRAEPPAVTP